jgi:hypothetical protein
MIDPAGRLHNLASAERTFSGGNKAVPLKSQSFTAELSDQLASTRKNAPAGPSLPAGTPARQQSVTWRQDSDGTSSSKSGSTATTTTHPSGLAGLVPKSNPTSSTTTSAASGSPQTAQQSFDDTYWANQPAAVQQLRDIQNPAQRTEVATQLAKEGYSIDVPIMVNGWDPQITTQLRQSMGYTWVPSALQQPIEVAPGLTFAGASYDPAHPPAGSIMVGSSSAT